MSKLLLCTDLDRTLIPNGSQAESDGARTLFSQLTDREDIQLAYVSGRDQNLIQQAIEDYNLPTPNFAIADVGSSIYLINKEQWQRWDEWDNEISQDWQGISSDGLHNIIGEIPLLQRQEIEKQGKFKCSYYVSLVEDYKAIMSAIKRRFQERQIKANLIWSVDEEKDIGLLDILPASANKLHAIMFLMQQQGFNKQQLIFAGDSGNDLDVLRSPLQSILVANASADVCDALQIEGSHAQDNVYLARGDFLGMNGNYSAGIIEGVAHYRPDLLSMIKGLK